MENNNTIDRIKVKDIFDCLKDIFITKKVDDQYINNKLQEVYKVQDKLGITSNIEKLEKRILEFRGNKVKNKKPIVSKESIIIKDYSNNEIDKVIDEDIER